MDDRHVFDNRQGDRSRYQFALASMICGIVAFVLCCTGILPIPLGALSILFALLSRREGERMDAMAKAGIWLSAAGIVMGILLFAYSLHTLRTDPETLEQFQRIYRSLYGEDFVNPWDLFQGSGQEALPTA